MRPIKYRKNKIVKAISVAFDCAPQSIYATIAKYGAEVIAIRLRNFARGKPENVASELEKLAVAFEQRGDA